MNVKECYAELNADYEGTVKRLMNEALVKRFALKFLEDPSFSIIEEGYAKQDAEQAFRGAHTLKGICLNLGFTQLQEVSSNLTEALCGRSFEGSQELFEKTKIEYERVKEILKKLAKKFFKTIEQAFSACFFLLLKFEINLKFSFSYFKKCLVFEIKMQKLIFYFKKS